MTGRQLGRALARLGISQSETARQWGVNPRTVRKWIAGDQPVPRLVDLVVLCWQEHRSLIRRRAMSAALPRGRNT